MHKIDHKEVVFNRGLGVIHESKAEGKICCSYENLFAD